MLIIVTKHGDIHENIMYKYNVKKFVRMT